MCYYLPTSSPPLVFTGDCLFKGGCGKFFEGTPAEMYKSINKLMELPGDTEVYPGHEYTVSNLEYAVWACPCVKGIKDGLNEVSGRAEERGEVTRQ
jgi:hydroxyacylglutathione hydrolase